MAVNEEHQGIFEVFVRAMMYTLVRDYGGRIDLTQKEFAEIYDWAQERRIVLNKNNGIVTFAVVEKK